MRRWSAGDGEILASFGEIFDDIFVRNQHKT